MNWGQTCVDPTHLKRLLYFYSVEIRPSIIDFHKRRSSLGGISRRLKISKQSVAIIIRKYKTFALTQSLSRSGRPPKLSPGSERKLVRMVRNNPKTTKKQVCGRLRDAGTTVLLSTVKRVLHRHNLRGCCARKKPLLHQRDLQARLKFASDSIDKEYQFWNDVLWSDAVKIELIGHNQQKYVWREVGEAFNPTKHHTDCKARGWEYYALGLFCFQWHWRTHESGWNHEEGRLFANTSRQTSHFGAKVES